MLNTEFSPWPSFSIEEANAVSQVLLSNKVNYWTGTETRTFEKEFAEWVGTEYAVAVMNGTVALELALLALRVGPGDEVIVTCRSFLASASSIVNVGATPVFADVDRDSQNISIDTIVPHLSDKTKAIICVHLAGWPCDMDPIMELATQRGIYVIEDCAQAHGARYKGRSVGSIGHISAWSFCQDKIMSTGGEGGMVTTNHHDWWSFMWSYKDHGKSWDAVYTKEHPPGFRWVHESFGTNWRMMDMQAVIGRIQLKKMNEWHQQRLAYAQQIWHTASTIAALRVPIIPDFVAHAAYKCYVFVVPQALKPDWSRDRVLNELMASGVPCYAGSCAEMYLEKTFENTKYVPRERLTTAKELGETSLMFLVHPTLTQAEIDKTCQVLHEVFLSAMVSV